MPTSRCDFLLQFAALATPFTMHATTTKKATVREVIDLILKSIPGAPFPTTVDTIKAGDIDQKVTGIVTTMFATIDVIRKTAKLGANFIIAHEPTFYNHLDESKGFEDDTVYKEKIQLLNKHKIVVWRFHDYIHSHKPDGVYMGVLEAIGWQKYYDESADGMITIAPASLGSIIELARQKLGIAHLRYIGDKAAVCKRILLLPGAAGGQSQISGLQKHKPDLLIVGELHEWETSEYVRDMRALGMKTSLIVLGHVQSEEPGMKWLVNWLQPQLNDITVTHIPSTDAFHWQ